jgi:hypothetical protein
MQKPFKNGRVITEFDILLGATLFDGFKDKNEICCAIAQKARFSQNVATKIMECICDTWKHQLK